MENNTLFFSLIILSQIIIWLLTLYIQGYIKKKGEYLATKQDIKEITNKVEEIRGEIEVSTSNEKWFISEQNKALIKLSEDIFTIIHKLKKIPEIGDCSYTKIQEFYISMDEFSTHKLNLGYLAILFDKEATMSIVESYYKILEDLAQHKKVILDDLNIQHSNAQIPSDEMPEDLSLQGYRYGDFCMQPAEYYKIRKVYFNIFEEKIYGKEYKAFTEYVRNFLKSSNRSN